MGKLDVQLVGGPRGGEIVTNLGPVYIERPGAGQRRRVYDLQKRTPDIGVPRRIYVLREDQ